MMVKKRIEEMHITVSPAMWIVASVMGIASAYLAAKRGKNPYFWFVIGFLFGIFGIFAIFLAGGAKKPAAPLSKQPVFCIDGPSDKFWYYLDPSHTQQGPMSKEALTTAWKSGKITASTFVWHEELTEWKLLKDTLKAEIS